ncbi:hypothetical protein MTR72_15930 [Bradyrhizobium sp. ISRA442]|uniref:hypothetical protein n=1 Tax=Bradyrhizobium sp. ISRA442 TaxID=2866197 RepID=UPI00311B0DFD
MHPRSADSLLRSRSETEQDGYLKDPGTLHCLICDEDHGVVARPCVIDGCKGDVIGLDEYRQAEVYNTSGQPQVEDA